MVDTTAEVAEHPASAAGSGTRRRPVSPAAHLADRFAAAAVSGTRGVWVREVPFISMVGLRATSGCAAVDRIESCLGLSLPVACGGTSTSGDLTVVWMSPDEFLVVSFRQQDGPAETSGEAPGEFWTRRLVEAFDGEPGSAIDLSADRTTLELGGPAAREVLEKGCALDLHPRSLEVGAAYLTAIGPVPVILWKVDEELYRLLPRSSYADFLGRWLLDAMAEFKIAELP